MAIESQYDENERITGKETELWQSLIIPAQRTSQEKYMDADGVLRTRYLKYKEMFKSDLMKAWMNSRDSELIEDGIAMARMVQQLDMIIQKQRKPVFSVFDRDKVQTDFYAFLEKEELLDGQKISDESRKLIASIFAIWLELFEKKTTEENIVDLAPSVDFFVDETFDMAIISAGRLGNAAKNVRTEYAYTTRVDDQNKLQLQQEQEKKKGILDGLLGQPKSKQGEQKQGPSF